MNINLTHANEIATHLLEAIFHCIRIDFIAMDKAIEDGSYKTEKGAIELNGRHNRYTQNLMILKHILPLLTGEYDQERIDFVQARLETILKKEESK